MAKLKAKRKLSKGRSLSTKPSKSNLPAVSADGQIMVHAGKYARNAVMTVFQQIGGTDAMALWADANQTDFYTKLFGKTMTREVEDAATQDTIEDLLGKLDEKEAIDAEFEAVE